MPRANERNLRRYWPIVYMAMDGLGLEYEEMLLMALGTIAAKPTPASSLCLKQNHEWREFPGTRETGFCFVDALCLN